jgi:hypothetical protein
MARPFGTLPDRFEPSLPPVGLALILPGSSYSPSAPALEFARQALLQHRYAAVQQVWWERPDDDGVDWTAWVGGQAAAALGAEVQPPERVLLVGKSLGTMATSYAASMRYDAIWLTPLLDDEECVAGIRANPGRQLLVGGRVDPFWDTEVAADLRGSGCAVLEIPDANHALWVDDDAVRSAEIQLEIARATEEFLAGQ